MISLVWFIASLWLIPIISWHYIEHGGVRTVPSTTCDTEYAGNTVFKIVTAILNFYLPLLIMYVLYGKIFHEIKKRSKFELGQRAGGASHNGKNHMGAGHTSSITDESEPKHCYESEHTADQSTYDRRGSSEYQASPEERRRFLNNPGVSRLTSDTGDTETSEDEHSRLHKGKYTNLRLMRKSGNTGNYGKTGTYGKSGDYGKSGNNNAESTQDSDAGDLPNSDVEIRIEYFYDETIRDPSTEKVHRFYDEHSREKFVDSREKLIDSREKHRNRNAFIDTAETSLTIPNRANVLNKQGSTKSTSSQKPLIVSNQAKKHVYFGKTKSNKFKEVNRRLFSRTGTGRGGGRGRNKRVPLINIRNKLPLDSSDCGSTMHSDSDTPHSQPPLKPNLVKKAKRFREKVVKHNVKSKRSPSLAREIKAAKQLGAILGAFTLCFMPYFILFMVVAFCAECVDINLFNATVWCGYLNSLLNPVLYPLCNLHFRRKFRRMLRLDKEPPNKQVYSHYYQHRTSMATDAMGTKYDF